MNVRAILSAAALAVSGLLMASSASAAVVSVQSGANAWGVGMGWASATPLASTEAAGIQPVSNWNTIWNGTGNTASPMSNLVDSTGAATTIGFSYNVPDMWGPNYTGTDPNKKLANSDMKSNGLTATATMTFTNVPAGTYDLVVYTINGDSTGKLGDYTAGGVTKYVENQHFGEFDGTTWLQSNSTTSGTYSKGNYITFTGVSPDTNGDIQLSWTAANPIGGGDIRASVNGIQLVSAAVPEPATLGLLTVAGAGILLRRRK